MKNSSPKVEKKYAENQDDDMCNINTQKKHSSSHKSDSANNVNMNMNMNMQQMSLAQLVDSLRNKIKIYEGEIITLIDEKIKMQTEINNLQLANCKSSNEFMNNSSNKNECVKELNKQYIQESSGLKDELKSLEESIIKQTDLITNQLIIPPKQTQSQIISYDNCPNCKAKAEELSKLNTEKQEICLAIKDLKEQLEEMKVAQSKKASGSNKNKVKKKNSINKSESLPSIEQYFILNNKFQLVDSDRNLWHMKKCQKFEVFKEQNKNNYSSAEDVLKAFVDMYDSKSDDDKNEDEPNQCKSDEKRKLKNK